MCKTRDEPNYRDESHDYQWWIESEGDHTRLTVEYTRLPRDKRLWRVLDILQQSAAPRQREAVNVS